MIARRPVRAFLFLTLSIGLMPASFVSLSREAGATARSSWRSTASRPSTVLVGFRDGVSQLEKGRIEHAVGASERGVIGAGTHVLHFAEGSVGVAIDKLKSYPQVRYAEPDYIVHADLTPNDRYYRQLWGMGAIHASQAWDLTTGSGGVVVGVVDTGIDYTHPDLAANVWTNTTGLNACPPGTHGYNVINGTCDPMDDNEHGTHVSGTIGAVGNNDIGVVGVSSNVSIMGLKFLNSYGSGTTSGAIAAIDWAVKAKQSGVNLRVLSNSWGGGGYSQALHDEIDKAGSNDILFVAAAGNNASNNDNAPVYPCNYSAANEICVAATVKNDDLASFSDYGVNSVDLSAPGSGILSTVPGGGYLSMSGTSMATPHVSGAAALVLSMGYEPVSALKADILASVDPVSSQAGLTKTGGRLNAFRAVSSASPSRPPPPVTGTFVVDASPQRRSIPRGSSTSYAVTVAASGGFTGTVTLSTKGLPPGASAVFSPVTLPLPTDGPSTLTLTTQGLTPTGRYVVTITGISGGLSESTTVLLQVKRN